MGRDVRRYMAMFAVALVALVGPGAPAQAVTGNFVPDFDHPFVGLVVFYDTDSVFVGRCSGSLLTPTLVLTAGHRVDGAASARVYFQQDAGLNYAPTTGVDPFTGYPETCVDASPCTTARLPYDFGHGNFGGFPNTMDAGLVILDTPIYVGEYASLALPGSVDGLDTRRGPQDVTFTISGYGLSRTNPRFVDPYRSRLQVTTRPVNLNNVLTDGFDLQTTANPGRGGGGTCFGDSGGPVFYATTNTIVGVTSFGLNQNRRGVNFAFRTDQRVLIDWVCETAAWAGQETSGIQVVGI